MKLTQCLADNRLPNIFRWKEDGITGGWGSGIMRRYVINTTKLLLGRLYGTLSYSTLQ
jgi:hypothetical protein